MQSKQIKNFRNSNQVILTTSVYSHSVIKVTKIPPQDEKILRQKYKNIWFRKIEPDFFAAQREVIAQELFRLVIPYQPKTRLAFDEIKNTSSTYILSKGVSGYRSFADLDCKDVVTSIANNTFRGLGYIIVLALLLNEIDFKFGNIGVDNQNRIVKIDGGWCFARLIDAYKNVNYKITEQIIKMLPLPDTYDAYNWLDGICSNVKQAIPPINAEIGKLTHFRAEVNEALLSVVTLPDELINPFVNSYIEGKSVKIIADEIIERIKQFKEAALANKDFQDYLVSVHAKNHLEIHINNLKEFKTTKKNYLAAKIPELESRVRENFANLRKSNPNEQKTVLAPKAATGPSSAPALAPPATAPVVAPAPAATPALAKDVKCPMLHLPPKFSASDNPPPYDAIIAVSVPEASDDPPPPYDAIIDASVHEASDNPPPYDDIIEAARDLNAATIAISNPALADLLTKTKIETATKAANGPNYT